MKMKIGISVLAATLLVSGSYANIVMEDWQFDDANGTQLSAVANGGTVASSWNFGSYATQNGNLNIGATPFYKSATGAAPFLSQQTFRTADIPDLTTGEYLFEVVIAGWDLGGLDGNNATGNGIKFNIGGAQVAFEVSQDTADIRARTSGAGGSWAQDQLGGFDLINDTSVTIQLQANLDTGAWSSQVDYGTGFVDLTTDGSTMTSIQNIQMVIDASNGSGWEWNAAGGAAGEYVTLDSVTLAQIPEPATMGLFGIFGGALLFLRRQVKI